MYFNLSTADKRSLQIQSASADLAALKTELLTETVGYITTDGKMLVMIDVIRSSVITLAPYPPNVSDIEGL